MANRSLVQIAARIRTLEKHSLQHVVEIGTLLEEAAEKCEHGTYRQWLRKEFGWSHDTARNYRNVATFAQKTKNSSFEKLNISLIASATVQVAARR
jgi:Protein of unknown function (DUF3102)